MITDLLRLFLDSLCPSRYPSAGAARNQSRRRRLRSKYVLSSPMPIFAQIYIQQNCITFEKKSKFRLYFIRKEFWKWLPILKSYLEIHELNKFASFSLTFLGENSPLRWITVESRSLRFLRDGGKIMPNPKLRILSRIRVRCFLRDVARVGGKLLLSTRELYLLSRFFVETYGIYLQ